jgi:hypothetical protein
VRLVEGLHTAVALDEKVDPIGDLRVRSAGNQVEQLIRRRRRGSSSRHGGQADDDRDFSPVNAQRGSCGSAATFACRG